MTALLRLRLAPMVALGSTILALLSLVLLVPSCAGRRGQPYAVRNTTRSPLLVRTSNTGETFACDPGAICPAPAKNLRESLMSTTAVPRRGGKRLRPKRIDPEYRSPTGEAIGEAIPLVEF